MEEGPGAKPLGVVSQPAALVGDRGFDLIERLEMVVGDHLVGQRPQALGRLKFGRVRRQEHHFDALRDFQILRDLPASPVEHEDHALVRTGTNLAGEGRQELAEQGRVHSVGHDPGNLAGRGPDEAEQLQPLEAMVADRFRPAAAGRPDAADHRLQPDPVLIERPDLERGLGIGVLTVLDLLPKAGFEGDLGIEWA